MHQRSGPRRNAEDGSIESPSTPPNLRSTHSQSGVVIMPSDGKEWSPIDPVRQAYVEWAQQNETHNQDESEANTPLLETLFRDSFGMELPSVLRLASRFAPPSFDVVAFVILLVSLSTRFFRLGFPNEVIFDEVHFGGFTNNYLKGSYFFDIHPPLTKVLFYYVSLLIGYDGHYDFEKITNSFDGDSYYYLRMLPAITGSLVPVMVYMTLREFRVNMFAAIVGSLFLVFDMCLLIESRIIVTDAVLMFFVAASFYSHSHIRNLKPLTSSWYVWLAICGTCIGGCISTKWTALGTMGVIGLDTLFILLNTWEGRLSEQVRRDWFYRALFLFSLPMLIYFVSFVLHFHHLPNSGPGDNLMPPEIQKRLIGNKFENDDTVVAENLFMSIIKLQIKMYKHNKAITQPHGSMSSWWSWPFMVHGMGYWGKHFPRANKSDSERRYTIYLMGNPFVWWTTTAALIGFITYIVRIPWRQRDLTPDELAFIYRCMVPVIGYMLNWLPYIFVPRVTFLYHYLPSLLYATILFGILLDRLVPTKEGIRPVLFPSITAQHSQIIHAILVITAAGFFVFFSPDTYAFPMSRAEREARRWFENWH